MVCTVRVLPLSEQPDLEVVLMNTRTLAVAALIIAVLLLLFLVILPRI